MHGWLKNRFNPSNESVIATRGSSQIGVTRQKETGENRSGGSFDFRLGVSNSGGKPGGILGWFFISRGEVTRDDP